MTELPRSALSAHWLILANPGVSWVMGETIAPPTTKLFLTHIGQSQITAKRLGFWGTSPPPREREYSLPI